MLCREKGRRPELAARRTPRVQGSAELSCKPSAHRLAGMLLEPWQRPRRGSPWVAPQALEPWSGAEALAPQGGAEAPQLNGRPPPAGGAPWAVGLRPLRGAVPGFLSGQLVSGAARLCAGAPTGGSWFRALRGSVPRLRPGQPRSARVRRLYGCAGCCPCCTVVRVIAPTVSGTVQAAGPGWPPHYSPHGIVRFRQQARTRRAMQSTPLCSTVPVGFWPRRVVGRQFPEAALPRV
jgi:hypothetical protein